MKVSIKKDIYGEGLWVRIEHTNELENVDWAITEEELLPIRDAIDKYMLENK